MEKHLEAIHCLSCDSYGSSRFNRKELKTLRSDASYSLLYSKAKTYALNLGITVEEEQERNTRLRSKLQPSKKLEEYYVMSSTGKCESMKSLKVKNFKTKVFYCCIDKFLQQLNERFSEKSKDLSTMGDERLSDLLVVSVEKEEANKINLNDAVDSFSKLKNRRYPLMEKKSIG
ncbi:hypothetical protein AGLY_011576 [Aphis glycines]|uniref:Uncharacterized protein n=1 Tax=Aphis glycines TaxID=307491 RepID=A0A6G0TC39_APHGL|nr:hypothetical protein AGLY_011576 [Aphis glycines]